MKRIVLVVMVVLAATLAISCGASNGKVQLTFLEVLTSPERTAMINGIIADYEKLHPNVTINLISPPYESADNKLTMMLNNDEKLDIIEVRDYTLRQFVNNKKLENLEKRLAAWSEGKDLLPIALASARTADNIAYIIPQFFYIKALFVRTDILAAKGITVMPKTFDELIADCKKVTNKKKGQFGFDWRGKSSEFKFSDLIQLSDVPNIDPNNIYKTADGAFSLATPEAQAALVKYVNLFKDSVPSDGINWGFNEQVNAFISGVTPFLIQDPDTVSLVDKQLGRDKYTVIPLPVGKSGKAVVDYGFASLGIPSYSKHKDAAWDFIKFFSSAKENAAFCKQYGPLPVHASTYADDPFFSTGVYQAWRTEMSDQDHYLFVKYPLGSEKWPAWPQTHEQTMQSLLLGKISPTEATAKFADYWK
ncbi:MAG: sugar ABC transporter substrate-binding protein [Treponema sp.]|nr:sugar ABC transporter substrate-binding protein [Treponema sp.]